MVIRGDWASPPPRRKASSRPFVPSPTRVDRITQGTIPAPQQRAPVYQQPYLPAPQQRAPAPIWTPPPAPAPVYAPIQNNWGGGGGGNFAGNSAPAFSAPAPPPPPPPDTRRRINSSKIGNKEIAELDSTFLDQDAALSEALKKFIADQTEEQGRQKRDTNTALTGIGRNKSVGLTGMSEDFAARGMQNSGLFVKSNADAAGEYEKQKQNTRTMLADNLAKLVSQRGKFESETNSTRQAARNEALARLARRSDLVVE